MLLLKASFNHLKTDFRFIVSLLENNYEDYLGCTVSQDKHSSKMLLQVKKSLGLVRDWNKIFL